MKKQKTKAAIMLIKGSVDFSGLVPGNHNTSIACHCVLSANETLLLRAVHTKAACLVDYYELFHVCKTPVPTYICSGHQYFTSASLSVARHAMMLRAASHYPTNQLRQMGYLTLRDCLDAIAGSRAVMYPPEPPPRVAAPAPILAAPKESIIYVSEVRQLSWAEKLKLFFIGIFL